MSPIEMLTSQIIELKDILGWTATIILVSVIVFAVIYIARWEIREHRRKGPEPWIGYTYSFNNGPEPGRRFIVKSVQDGNVVLEELEK